MTNFFRDPAFFEKLKYNAVYKIIERAAEDEPIRVWSAGCSTGEEAYSSQSFSAKRWRRCR